MDLFGMLSGTPAILTRVAAQVPAELVRVRSGPFALVEHVWHMADLEREFAERIRRLLGEADPFLPDFDGERVAKERQYLTLDLAAGLTAFASAREETLRFLGAVASEAWARCGRQEGVGAFARGARSSGKRFGGALEPFQRVEALVAEREGQELWALREARVVEAHPRLRDDLHRIAHAGYAAELIHELTRAGQPADALFTLMEDFLTRLEAGMASSARLRALELLALESAGFAAELV